MRLFISQCGSYIKASGDLLHHIRSTHKQMTMFMSISRLTDVSVVKNKPYSELFIIIYFPLVVKAGRIKRKAHFMPKLVFQQCLRES